MIKEVILLIMTIVIAIVVGKLVAKVKLPAILGWLMTGMILGPHAIGLLGENILSSEWFHVIVSIGEVGVGLIIGTELIWKELKQSGKQLMTICFTEALGAFVIVTAAFAIIFASTGLPVSLAFVFGAIALATAPAPSLAIVKEYQTKGPVTKTLIPLAAIDDMVAVVVFFVVIGVVASGGTGGMPLWFVPLMLLVPLAIGIIPGIIAGKLLNKYTSVKASAIIALSGVLATGIIGLGINHMMGGNVFNPMLMGIAYSAVFANMISKERIHEVMGAIMPVVGIVMTMVILNLGAPLDYHLILGAGIYTAVYIIARGIGKVGGSFIGARISKAPKTVERYLGLTLLPHSGVSLVFTGIAVSMLGQGSEEAMVIQGTIAAAAVINEIIAVFLAKQGFKMAGEINGSQTEGSTDEIVSEVA